MIENQPNKENQKTEHMHFDAYIEDDVRLKKKAKENFGNTRMGCQALCEPCMKLKLDELAPFCVFNPNAKKTDINFNANFQDAELIDAVQKKYDLPSKGDAFHVICNVDRGISETAESTQIQVKQELSIATYIPPMPIAETQQEQANRLFKNDGYCPSQKRMIPLSILPPKCEQCVDSHKCKWCITKKPSERDPSGDRLREALFLKREALESEEKIKLEALTKAMDKKDEIAQRQFEREYKLQLLKVPRTLTSEKIDMNSLNCYGCYNGSAPIQVGKWLGGSETPTWIKDSRQKDQEEMRQRYIEQLMREKTRETITSKDLEELRQLEKIDPTAIAKIELSQEFGVPIESLKCIEQVQEPEIHALTDEEESNLNAYFYFLHFCLKCNRAISPLTGGVIIKATSDVVFEQNPAENLRNLSIAVLGEVAT